jgi:uncharacterized RDD family membrane protein YckC
VTTWYYADGQRQVGPYSEEAFQALVSAGTVHGDTLVWNESMTDWKPYRATLAPGGPVAGEQAVCSMCNRILPADEVIEFQGHYVCALCKPEFVQRLKEGLPVTGLVYAGFWIRFVAIFIDGLIMAAIGCGIGFTFVIVMMPTVGTFNPDNVDTFMPVFQLLNYGLSFVGRFGATPGKMLLRLRVVRPDGSSLTYLRAFGRYWATIVSNFTCYIGYIMAAFDEEKRALHDKIASTRVIVTG